MGQTGDNYHSKSDNVDTQPLYLNANLGVVSTIYPRDRTGTQLLHNKPITDELTATSPSPRWTAPTSPHSSCKGSATRCSPSARTLSGASSNQ